LKQAPEGSDFLMKRVCEDLGERLSAVDRRFPRAGTLFCVTRDAALALLASGKVDEVLQLETSADILAATPDMLGVQGMVTPAETIPLEPETLDLAVSILSLQEANDVPGMLVQIRRALRPDGLFLGAMAGGDTLHELRESLLAAEAEVSGGASPRVAPFADVRDIGALLQRAGLALPVADVETVTVRYGDMFSLMRDLRGMGATTTLVARSRKPATRSLFLRAAEIYAERFADPDGRIRATFSILWMSGWAPDASQPKALKPGSAKVSLASVLEDPGNRK
jgi:SAM-dependent methyltransferase